MQAPNAQGIMGLMAQGRAPQQPQQPQQQMPSPMKASPMAGLGSVEDRVAAYRGNPAPLQQRYQMSQDLLDLLALQKIKSEKDAAARQMQLAMGQQQAAQGMEPQTIAQQREKEVMELTKNELAQQRGETAQQQQSQQQEALKRALSGGVAAAPGAATAAQPKAMAAGGIVAFAGDTDGSVVPSLEEQDPEFDADGNPRPRSERERIMAQNARIREMKGNAQALGGMRERRMAGLQTANAGLPELMSEFYKPRRPDVTSASQAVVRPGATPAPAAAAPAAPTTAAAPAAAPAPAQMPQPAAPVAATPRPAAPPAAPGAPAGGLASLVDKTATGMMEQDPEARQRAMEERIRAAYALSPEQKAVYEQGIAQRQKMFDEAYDPEKQRQQGLIKFLTGAGGRRYGELAGGAEAAGAFDESQRQAKLKDFEAMQKSREGLVGLEREGIKPSIEGGLKALEVGEAARRSGLEAGFKRVEGALDRESREKISADSNRIQLQIKQAMQEQTMEAQRGRIMQDINRLEARGIEGVDKGPIGKAIANLEQIKSFNPKAFTKEQQAELDAQYRKLEDAKEAVRLQVDVYREQATGRAGKAAKGEYKVTEIKG